jgi:predicted PurR-regulated permease PerM
MQGEGYDRIKGIYDYCMNNGVVSGLNQVFHTNANLMKFVVITIFKALFSIADLLSNFVFYIVITVMYVDSETSLINSMLLKIPNIKPSTVQKVQSIIETPINIVYHHNVVGVVAQGVFTWIIFDCLGAKYAYIHCFMAAIFKLIPIVPVQVIALLGAINLYYRNCSPVFAGGLGWTRSSI